MSKRPVPPARSAAPPPGRARRYRGVDASQRIEERRRQFVAAGVECFGTRGYHPVTVRELCAEAQLTERYFYESFSDREALFCAVYEHLIERLRQDFVAAAARRAPVPAEMARAGLGVFFRGLQKDPRLARIVMIEVLTVSAAMESRALRATFGFADLIRELAPPRTPVGTAGDARRSAAPDLVTAGLVGAVIHIAMRWIADDYHPSARIVIDTAMTFFDASLRPPGASAPRAP